MTESDPSNSAERLLVKSKTTLDAQVVRQEMDKIKSILAPFPRDQRQIMIDTIMNELPPEPHVVVPPPQ
jgi:hypothetical protein